MAVTSGLMPCFSGTIHPKLPVQIPIYNRIRFRYNHITGLDSKKMPKARIHHIFQGGCRTKYTLSVGRNHHELAFDDGIPQEPFWLNLIKEALRGLKSLLAFLAEQPRQLKYIEWPSFQSTLKTSTLTLVLVALLIVALSSVDSGLCYMLTLLLRRKV